jgi:hypothetical protein
MATAAGPVHAPLQDHFRPPLSLRRHWHAFHNAWATYLSSDLNAKLPEGYFAESNVQFGIEIDVAAFEEEGVSAPGATQAAAPAGPATGTVASPARSAPPAPALTVPFSPPTETVEVLVFDSRHGPTLAGAVELVSPANKDRPESRDAFVAKCQSYLNSGAGLVIVDVVTGRLANLHDELLGRLNTGQPVARSGAELYATSYHPIERDGAPALDAWHERLNVGQSLPTQPLWLRGGLCLPVDLATTYERTCREQRVPVRGG